MRYFAYGSNMDLIQMASRCPGATPLAVATLEGHRVAFVRDDTGFDGGVATIVPDAGGTVAGVLWEIELAHVDALDEWEVYPVAYDRRTIVVHAPTLDASPIEAMTYVCNYTTQLAPSRRYLDVVVRGARANGLPTAYVESLRRHLPGGS